MKTRIIVVILGLFLLIGCGSIRQWAVDLSKEDMANAETSREIARNFLANWPLNSGFIRTGLGARISEFPKQFHEALDELDALAKKPEAELTDTDLGDSLGYLIIRIPGAIVQEALNLYAPDILKLLPAALIF